MRSLPRLVVLVFSFVFCASLSCTKKKSTVGYGLDPAETLRINIVSEPPTLDWSKSTDTTSALIQYNIMDGLTGMDLNDPELKLTPALALSWDTKDAKTWTFKLRKDVTWSDGVAFTGQHVIDGWERILNPKTASEYAYQLYGVKNARAYNEGKLADFSQVGIKVNVEGDLVVELERPKAYFPYLLGHHSTYPIRKDLVAQYGDDAWTNPENLVSLGAYTLKTWDHDKAVVMERNPTYYGEPARIKYVLAYIIPELSTAINLFNAGQIDALNELPSHEITQLKTRPEYREQSVLGIYYYGFNTSKPPFDDPKVRKAVSMAIDREQIATLMAGGQTPITSWVPKGMMGYEPDVGIKPDIAKAQKMLDEAGFKDRSKFPRVTLGFNTQDSHQRIAENVQAQLKKNLGIDVELANEEWKTFLQTLKTDPPSIFRMGWLADYPDPDNFLNLMTSFSDNNHTRWGNEKFDSLIQKAVSITDKAERLSLYKEAQEILTEKDAPVVPIFTMVSQHLISNRVKNYPVNPMRQFKFDKVSFEEETLK